MANVSTLVLKLATSPTILLVDSYKLKFQIYLHIFVECYTLDCNISDLGKRRIFQLIAGYLNKLLAGELEAPVNFLLRVPQVFLQYIVQQIS